MRLNELREIISNYVARVVLYAVTSKASSSGQEDQVLGRGDSDQSVPVRRLWNFGLRSVPPDGSEAIALAINGGRLGARVMIAAEHRDHGPKDMESGETSVYSAFEAVVRLDKRGRITIVPKSGALVLVGSDDESQCDPVVYRSELNAALKKITDAHSGHVHDAGTLQLGGNPVTGTTGAAGSVSASVQGSSNVKVKK